MVETVQVKPRSSKAKNRLANVMDKDPWCTVENRKDGALFLLSKNSKYCFWVGLTGWPDPNWELVRVTEP
jgi:hypothetical protein